MSDRDAVAWRDRRGQVVLLAAATVAIALVPMLVAYLQLGYHADVEASAEFESPVRDAERELGHAVRHAERSIAGDYAWSEREAARRGFLEAFEPARRQLERARVEDGIAVEVARNRTAGDAWAREACPSGPKRAFGPCRADGGIIFQERAGETHLLGAAFDVRVTTSDGWTELTVRIRSIPG